MAVDLNVDKGVGVISLNRPPANAYDWSMLRELSEALDRVRENGDIRVVLLRSANPKFFCTGADISTLKDSDRAKFANFLTLAHETVDRIGRTPKLFIAAIAGHCLGGGLELALCCDLRFAAAGKYRIGLSEVNLGLSPGMGGTQRLPRLIRRSRALQMMVTGEPVGADEALELGIVDRVFPEDKLEDEALAYAAKLATGATLAQGYIKLSVNMGLEASLSEGLAIERAHQNQLFSSEDVAEGLKAFLEKRPPQYRGR
jgi:enoyl-CoA hydratase/carnithine racemase